MPDLHVIVTKKDFESSGSPKKGWFRWVWRFGVVFLGLLLLGLLGLVMFFPSDTVKEKILSTIEQQTGHRATLGDIDLAFSLIPTLHLHQFSMEDIQGKTLVDLSHAKLTVAVMPLLQKQLHIKSVELNGATVNVIKDAQGRLNVLGKLAEKTDTDSTPMADGQAGQESQSDLNVDSLKLSAISIEFADEQTGMRLSVRDFGARGHIALPADEALAIEASLESTVGSLRVTQPSANLDLDLPAVELGLALKVDRASKVYTLEQLRLELPGIGVDFSGVMHGTESVELALKSQVKDLATVRHYIGDLMPVLPIDVTQAELKAHVKGPAGFWGGFPQSGNIQNWINVLNTLELTAGLTAQGLRTSVGVFADVDARLTNKDKTLTVALSNAFYDATKLTGHVSVPLRIPLAPVVSASISKIHHVAGGTQVQVDNLQLTLPLTFYGVEGLMPKRVTTDVALSAKGVSAATKSTGESLLDIKAMSWSQALDLDITRLALAPSTGKLTLDKVVADLMLSLPEGKGMQGEFKVSVAGVASSDITKMLPGFVKSSPVSWQKAGVTLAVSHPRLAAFEKPDYISTYGYLVDTNVSAVLETKGVEVDAQPIPDGRITATLAAGKLALAVPAVKTLVGEVNLQLSADVSQGGKSALPYNVKVGAKALAWLDDALDVKAEALRLEVSGAVQLPHKKDQASLRVHSGIALKASGVQVVQAKKTIANVPKLTVDAKTLYDAGSNALNVSALKLVLPGVELDANTAIALDTLWPLHVKSSLQLASDKSLRALLPGLELPVVFKQVSSSGTVSYNPDAKPTRDDVFGDLEGLIAKQTVSAKQVAMGEQALRDAQFVIDLKPGKAKLAIQRLSSPYGPVSGHVSIVRGAASGYLAAGDIVLDGLRYVSGAQRVLAKHVALVMKNIALDKAFSQYDIGSLTLQSKQLTVMDGKSKVFATTSLSNTFAGVVDVKAERLAIKQNTLKTDAIGLELSGTAQQWGQGDLALNYVIAVPKVEAVQKLVPAALQGLVLKGENVGLKGNIAGRLFDKQGEMMFTKAKVDATVSAGSLVYDKVPLKDTVLSLSLASGQARMVLQRGNVFSNKLNGALFTANMVEERPTWQLDKVDDTFAMQQIIKVYTGLGEQMGGQFNVKINKVGAKGFAQDDLKKSMSGRVTIGLSDGKVSEVKKLASSDNLPNSMKLFFVGFKAIQATGLDRLFGDRGLSNFYLNLPDTYEFSIDPSELTIKEGRIYTPQQGIHVKSLNAQSLTFRGSFGLDNTIHGTAIITDVHRLAPERYQKYLQGLALPIDISGPVDNPQYDDRRAKKTMLKLATRLVLQKALGGEGTAPQGNQAGNQGQAQPPSESPPANADPRDALEDKLKDAGKGLLFDLLNR